MWTKGYRVYGSSIDTARPLMPSPSRPGLLSLVRSLCLSICSPILGAWAELERSRRPQLSHFPIQFKNAHTVSIDVSNWEMVRTPQRGPIVAMTATDRRWR